MGTEISTVARTVQNNLIEKISREETRQKSNSIFSYLALGAPVPFCCWLLGNGSGGAKFIMGAEIRGFDLDSSKSPWWIRLARRIFFFGRGSKKCTYDGMHMSGNYFPDGP